MALSWGDHYLGNPVTHSQPLRCSPAAVLCKHIRVTEQGVPTSNLLISKAGRRHKSNISLLGDPFFFCIHRPEFLSLLSWPLNWRDLSLPLTVKYQKGSGATLFSLWTFSSQVAQVLPLWLQVQFRASISSSLITPTGFLIMCRTCPRPHRRLVSFILSPLCVPAGAVISSYVEKKVWFSFMWNSSTQPHYEIQEKAVPR